MDGLPLGRRGQFRSLVRTITDKTHGSVTKASKRLVRLFPTYSPAKSFRHVSKAMKSSTRPRLATVHNNDLPPASLPMSISCTFKHLNANVRALKHKVHTQQPYSVAYVFKNLQPHYLSRTMDMANYYAINSVRCAFMYMYYVANVGKTYEVSDFS